MDINAIYILSLVTTLYISIRINMFYAYYLMLTSCFVVALFFPFSVMLHDYYSINTIPFIHFKTCYLCIFSFLATLVYTLKSALRHKMLRIFFYYLTSFMLCWICFLMIAVYYIGIFEYREYTIISPHL